MSNYWQNRPVTVLGLSKTGIAAAKYLQAEGAKVFLSETLPATPGNEAVRNELTMLGIQIEMGGHTAQCFQHSDLVIASPGIPPSGSIIEQLEISGKTIISEVEFAYRETLLPGNQIPIIGITGTNGKSTTTTLISEILTAANFDAPACGNIGTPIVSLLNRHPDYLVAELSSYQLAFSPKLTAEIAVLTNLTPDHIEWHGSLDAYKKAKQRLVVGDQAPQWAVLNGTDAFCKEIAKQTTAKVLGFAVSVNALTGFENKIYVDAKTQRVTIQIDGQSPMALFDIQDLKIIGNHNIENVLASVGVACLLDIDNDVITKACLNFKGLAHRLERIWFEKEKPPVTGIAFYNDSKATNPESAISALKAFPESQPVVLIAGGYDKMTPLEEFAAEIKKHAAHVVLLGNAAARFNEALQKVGIVSIEISDETGLQDAVNRAVHLSLSSSDLPYPVLFSPACASFDMFKNYEERGDVFKQTVQALLEKETPCPVP